MAKVVIAGRADCPYFSRIELLGDRLVKNLPSFQLHKIVKTPDEWQTWLNETCHERGWQHASSPLVWRELIDRGGKGVLIGGASDFQEYVNGYYGLGTDLTSNDMQKIGSENLKTKQEIDAEEAQFKALSNPLNICITAAESATCYAVMSAIGSGEVFGPNTEINLRLYDTSSADFDCIQGLAMETQDLCSGLVRGIKVERNPVSAFRDCSVIIVLDELLQGEEEDYHDWIRRNNAFFSAYARDINSVAKRNVRVLVAGNGPVNFNAMMMIRNAPNIPRQNIVALSRGVENRAKAVIGQRLNVNTAGVVDLIIWGNVNGKHYVDNSKSRVHGYDGAVWGPPSYSVPVVEMVHDNKWLEKEYLELVEQRRSTVETALGHSASGSAGRAVVSMLSHWWSGSPPGQMFSLGVCSDGWYDIPEGLVFSYPVTLSPKGYWNVVQDIHLDEETKLKIKETVKDLVKEYEVMYPPPCPPAPPSPEAAEPEQTPAAAEEEKPATAPAADQKPQEEEKAETEAPKEPETETTDSKEESGEAAPTDAAPTEAALTEGEPEQA